jgi:hypothetical protein
MEQKRSKIIQCPGCQSIYERLETGTIVMTEYKSTPTAASSSSTSKNTVPAVSSPTTTTTTATAAPATTAATTTTAVTPATPSGALSDVHNRAASTVTPPSTFSSDSSAAMGKLLLQGWTMSVTSIA